jgi:serine/threonine-protein kinase
MTPERYRLIGELFHAALEVESDERASFLERACASDEELRREVESLIISDQQSGDFIAALPSEMATQEMSTQQSAVVGQIINHYKITSHLGTGGMGEVYCALDTRLARNVAIKVLSSDIGSDADGLARFRAEARAISSLNHPNVLVIHDIGEIDGRPFIVTELVEGQTLAARLSAGPLPMQEATAIATQIASALAAAHARDIVHRDIKPQNIMIRSDGYAKVLDFGVAKFLSSDSKLVSDELTRPGLVVGTPRYMSPEQARGEPVDARTDIWSLAAVLYEMLAGRPPFLRESVVDTLHAIIHEEPAPLWGSPAVAALDGVIHRALSKKPTDRYSSADEFARAIRAVDTQVEKGESHTHVLTRLIVMPFRLLRPDADIDYVGFALADAIASSLSGLRSVAVRSTLAATRFQSDALDIKMIAAETDVDAIVTGTLLRAGDRLRFSAQLIAAPAGNLLWSHTGHIALKDLFALEDDLTRQIVESLAAPLAERESERVNPDVPANARAYELYLRANHSFWHTRDWTIARELYQECVRLDPRYAPAWARLGRCLRLTAKFEATSPNDVRTSLQRADESFQRAFAISPELPSAHSLFTALECDLGRAAAAITRLLEQVRGHSSDAELYTGLVYACRYCGLLDESVAAHERAKRLDPNVQTSVINTFWMKADYEKALDEQLTGTSYVLGLTLATIGKDDEAIRYLGSSTRNQYARPLLRFLKGDWDGARQALDELLPINPDAESHYYLARLLVPLGDIEGALREFERIVDMGFFCLPVFTRDPWLEPVRGLDRFQEILRTVEARHTKARDDFNQADGGRLLGLRRRIERSL